MIAKTVSERTKQIEQLVSLSIIALLIIGSIILILPFLPAILWAIVFAVTTWPFFARVEKALGGRTTLAAIALTLLVALIFFVPMVYVGFKLSSQASIAFNYAQEWMEEGLGPPPAWLKTLPLVGERVEGVWKEIGQDTPKLIETIKPYIGSVLGSIISAGAGIARLILVTILSLIFFLFILKEGRSIRIQLEKMAIRLAGEKGRHLLLLAGATMRSVVYGILGTAMIQAILAIFGLWISGIPNPIFIGTVAGVFALVPIGLIQVILLPAAGWLIFYKGQVGWGIFLFIWSFTIVGNIDSVIRPMLISRGAKIPFLVVFLGVLGGIATGGIIGLFVGATLLAVFYTVLKEWVSVSEQNMETTSVAADSPGERGPGMA